MTERRTEPVLEAEQADPHELGLRAALARLALADVAPLPVELAGFRHVSERELGPWICCAPCSGAMVAAWAIGTPATLAKAHDIRAAIPLPHRGGMSPSELWRGVRLETGLELERIATSRAVIGDRLEAGYAIAVAMTYGALPTALRRWSPAFTGGHMGVLAGVGPSGSWGWWDPLAPAGWRGEYVSPAEILPALWTEGAAGAVGGVAMDYTFDVERWLLDGRSPVTTFGAPRRPDGSVDWSRRLAFVTDREGANPRLTELPRDRLSGANDAATSAALETALATYSLPTVVDARNAELGRALLELLAAAGLER